MPTYTPTDEVAADVVTAAHTGVRAALERCSLHHVVRPAIRFAHFQDTRRSALSSFHPERPELVLDPRLSPVEVKHAAAAEMRHLYRHRRGLPPDHADALRFADQVVGRSAPAVALGGAASLVPVKALGETESAWRIGGYGVVFGGRDLSGQYFAADTRFWDGFAGVPVLVDHGLDSAVGKTVIGRVIATKVDEIGLWVELQIQKAAEYARAVMELVRRGVVGLSSGSASHLVEVARDGKILSWPIVEVSVTTQPMEPRTLGVRELAEARALAGILG